MSYINWGAVLTSKEAASLVKLSTAYLAELRRDGQFIEGVHYVKRSMKSYVWLTDPMQHWSLHRTQPTEHRNWILSQTEQRMPKSSRGDRKK